MSKFKKLMVAGVATLGLLSMQAAPASAGVTVASGAFTGVATVNPGLYYPVSNDPACGTPVGVCPAPTNGTWSFTATTGVGGGIVDNTPTAGAVITNTPIAGALVPGASGVGPYCGVSGGINGGNSTLTKELSMGLGSVGVLNVGWTTSAATLIPFSGDAYDATGTGTIVGLVSAIPPTSGQSCLAGTAKTFAIVGAAAVVIP